MTHPIYMTKIELSKALSDFGVTFSPTATIQELRSLYAEHSRGASAVGNDSEPMVKENNKTDSDANQNSAPTQTEDEKSDTNFEAKNVPPSNEFNQHYETQSNASFIRPCDEEMAIDAEIRLLEKRKKLAELRRELHSDSENVNMNTNTNTNTKIDFNDIKHSIVPFSNSEEYDAHKWIEDFERSCDTVNSDAAFRLKSIRRLMKPDSEGELFLRVDDSKTYQQFRANFLENFGHNYTISDVLNRMRKTTFNSAKTSVMGYILKMQELASRANIDERQTIQFIIDGLQDRSANIAVLYPAEDLTQLKKLSHRYVQLREASVASTSTFNSRTNVPVKPKSTSDTSKSSANSSVPAIRCFNCSGTGHFSGSCPEPKRVRGSCFRCGSTQHIIKDCNKPAPKNTNQVALIDEFRSGSALTDGTMNEMNRALQDANEISEFNNVSVTFFTDGFVHARNTLFSLFDSGSPVSLITIASVPKQLVNNQTKDSGYNGLGQLKLCTYGIIQIKITFRNITKIVKVYVIPNHLMNVPLLLGRNALKAFKIKFYIEPNVVRPTIEIDKNDNKIKISGQVLHCVYDSFGDNEFGIRSLCESCHVSEMMHSVLIQNTTENCRVLKNMTVDDDNLFSEICNIMIDDTVKIEYDINSDLNVFHREFIKEIINEHYSDLSNIPARAHDYKIRIRLTSENPISFRPRRLSYGDKQIVDKTIDELLNNGVIRPSTSPYAFPLVLVPKKDGTKRMCIDYKPLNKIMIRDSYPMPLIDDCLERMEGHKYFTVLDLKNGFHQIAMSEESVPYTSFVTPSGQYEYLKLPFGLKIGPGCFMRFINWVLQEFIREGSVIVFMDDITIFSRTIPEHLDLLKKILRRLAEFRLEIKPSKCKFCYTKIELLGFTVSHSGIRPNNRHLETVQNLPLPTNTAELKTCLGFFSHFRRFIKSYSTISEPLRQLIKPNVPFVFDEKCKSIFRDLCNQLTSSPILAIYSPKRETELHCDASARGYGGILFQRQDDEKMHPIAYYSKSTTAPESTRHSYELETMAVVYSVKKFHTLLDGIPFKIITDCDSLARTLEKQATSPRIARWSLFLDNYDYTIKHRSGSLMNHVDALSRYHPISVDKSIPHDNLIAAINYEDIDIQLYAMQNRDNKITDLRTELEAKPVENYSLENGLVYRKYNDKLLLYVPEEVEGNIIRIAHEKICHMGIDKCMDQIKMHYWFPKMKDKVEQFIRNCLKCLINSVPPQSNYRTLHNIPKKPIPFDTIHVDHFGPLPSIISKRKHIFAVTDAFTKHVKLYSVNSTSTKEVCACLNKYFEHYSRPRRIISDRGTCFTSYEFDSFLRENNIEHVKIATASAQANGQIERVNRTLKSILSKISEPIQHSDWAKLLIRVEYALNNSVHSSTRKTPCHLLFGVDQRGLEIDQLTEYLEDKRNSVRDLDKLRADASEQINKSQKRNSDYHCKNNKPHCVFSENDYVMIRNVDTTIGTNKKFLPKYRGPYVVHKVLPNDRYVIKDVENCQLTQLPYTGIIEANRMRLWVDWRDSRDSDSDSEK